MAGDFDPTTAVPVDDFDPTSAVLDDFDTGAAVPVRRDLMDMAVRAAGVPFGIPFNQPVPSPGQMMAGGHPNLGAAAQTAQDALTIPTHYFNQMAFNYPRSTAASMGYELPIHTDNPIASKVANMAGLAGGIQSPLTRLALRGGPRPWWRHSLEGAALGAAYAPSEGLGQPGQRLQQAAFAGTLPAVAAGAVAGGKFLGKGAADYLTRTVAPKMHEMYQRAVAGFHPGVEKFARERLKVPESAIQTIKTKGTDAVQKVRQRFQDSTDPIFQRINRGFVKRRGEADLAYRTAVKQGPAQLNAEPFFQSLRKVLLENRFIDLQGNPTTRYRGGLDPVLDELTSTFMDLRNAQAGGRNIRGHLMAKNDFMLYRDKFGRLLRDAPSDRNVMQVREALYDSAERSGMTGLKTARDLERKAFEMEAEFQKLGTIGERALDRFHSLPEETRRGLQAIEDYVGEPFLDDLAGITAGRELDKFAKRTPVSMARDLERSVDPRWTKLMEQEYTELLGPGAQELFSEVVSARRARNLLDPVSAVARRAMRGVRQ